MKPAAGAEEVGIAAALTERSSSSLSDCTDCSHCAGRSKRRSRAGVRVSVDLRQFFSDQRALAYMWAPYGRCVQWLSRRIARVFGLPGDLALMSRGHVLPMMEPLLLLHRRDPVQVVKMSYVFTPHNKQDESNVNSQSTINEESELTRQPGINVSSRQSDIYFISESTRPLPTSRKGDEIVDQNIYSIDYPKEATTIETTIGSMESQTLDVSEDLQRLKQHALRLLDEHCHMLQEGPPPKRVRRRRRRRRPQQADTAPAASEDEEPPHSGAGPAPQDTGAAVLRNGCGSRPPRLVRALSPSHV